MKKQPPPRGCVLKLCERDSGFSFTQQPPPRGCVLKHKPDNRDLKLIIAAASARLCVETFSDKRL